MHLLESPRSAQSSCPIFNKQLIEIDLMIFEVFLYLDDTIDNNDDNVQEVEKDTEVCRDLFRLWLVFFIFQDASYNLRIVIFNRTAFRLRCFPYLIQSIIPPPAELIYHETNEISWSPGGLKKCGTSPQENLLVSRWINSQGDQENFHKTFEFLKNKPS